MTRIFFKKGQRIAVKRNKSGIMVDKSGKQYSELDEEGILLYQLLSDGFTKEAKDKARERLIAMWSAAYRRSVKP